MYIVIWSGCSALSPGIDPANLLEPGWTLREGQAVWRLPRTEKDIAGELLLATRPGGGAFIQFTKSPFTLVVARTHENLWEAEFPPQNKRYSGRGEPPKRLIWLQLARILAGQPPPENWGWRQDETGWRLENPANGEALEGYFNP